MKKYFFILFFCACSDVPKFYNSDAGANQDADPDTTFTDTDIDTESSLDLDTDTDIDSDVDTDTDTDTDTETHSDPDAGSACPWECKLIVWADPSQTCDPDLDDPCYVRNYNFDCPEDYFCCQPIHSEDPGALTDPCPWNCRYEFTCTFENGGQNADYYCLKADTVCCEDLQ